MYCFFFCAANNDVVEAHATALNCTVTFLSIHVAKTDFSETFRPRGSSSVTNNSRSKRLTEICDIHAYFNCTGYQDNCILQVIVSLTFLII